MAIALASFLLAFGLGAGLGCLACLLIFFWRQRGGLSRRLPRARQLLSWLDSSATGWILLDQAGNIGGYGSKQLFTLGY